MRPSVIRPRRSGRSIPLLSAAAAAHAVRRLRPAPLLVLLAVALAGSLGGCGFALRGAVDIPAGLSPVYVRGGDLVGRSVETRLAASGVPSTKQAADAGLIVDILAESRDARVVAVDQNGKALAYVLTFRVRFAASDGAGNAVVVPQQLALDRTFDDNPDVAVLGKELETDIIYNDMADDAADQVLLRLRAALRQRAGATG